MEDQRIGDVVTDDGVRVSGEPGDGRVYVVCGYVRSGWSVSGEGKAIEDGIKTLETPSFRWREERKMLRPAYDCVYVFVWVAVNTSHAPAVPDPQINRVWRSMYQTLDYTKKFHSAHPLSIVRTQRVQALD